MSKHVKKDQETKDELVGLTVEISAPNAAVATAKLTANGAKAVREALGRPL
jgi:hypothetical protein